MASRTIPVRLRKVWTIVRLPRLRREEGTVLPLVALALVVIVGMAAFAIDLSGWYFDQRHLQMQADSAVTAGAQQLVKNLSNCAAVSGQVKDTAANYAGVGTGSSPITSNNEPGTVGINTTVSCSGAQGAYVDSTVTNSSPPSFFSGIFGAHPSLSAHARASLLQVTAEGGSTVLPYAITQSKAVYNNQLIQITVNSSNVKQALVCDGSGASNSTSDTEMYSLQVSGCPLTQANNGTTCPATPTNPPSCLWQFTGVSESSGFDAGHVYRFEGGQPWPGATKVCTQPNPIPTNNYSQYLATGTLPSGDPRAITVFVVPDGSLTSTGGLVPIVGYGEFYLEGWDHDPCAPPVDTAKNPPDPANPGPQGNAGTVWGYFIQMVNPEGTNVQGGGPCNPVPTQAWTYNCTYALTQ